MKNRKKAIIFIFAIVLTILMSVPINADILSSSKVTATIDSHLQSLLRDASADERIPVDIWLYETSTSKEREQKIFSRTGISITQIAMDTKSEISSKKIDEYIMTERSMYAEERNQQYETIRLQYSNVQGLQKKRQADTRLFYSQYAPMISAELTPAEIKLLAYDNYVESIYYSPDVSLKNESDISVPSIGAGYVRDTLNYTGSGIKIGMIEECYPNKAEDYFIQEHIICNEASFQMPPNNNEGAWREVERLMNHANTVAFLMVGQETTINNVTYRGIVPDATLYATAFNNDIDRDWRIQIEWLLSQGVHIINMSACINEGIDGHYGEHERWVDHITNDHRVHFVKSSGNLTDVVTSPGMAYNIITVGAIDDRNDNQEGNDLLYNGSNYREYSSENAAQEEIKPTNKPDLVAPGVGIYTPAYSEREDYSDSGTSFAAPHVTAVIAQLCQRFPSLRVLQAGVKAILTASISHSVHAYDSSVSDANYYDKYGAGVINAKAAFETANAYRMVATTLPSGDGSFATKQYTFTATAGQRVRVALTWQKYAALHETVPHAICNPTDFDLAHVALYVRDPDGLSIGASTGAMNGYCNNTEIYDFIAPKTGTYTMAVTNYTPSSVVTDFGLAWWLKPLSTFE